MDKIGEGVPETYLSSYFVLVLVAKMAFKLCSSIINIIHVIFLIYQGGNNSFKHGIAKSSLGHSPVLKRFTRDAGCSL